MSKIHRKFKKPEHKPGVKDGFIAALGVGGILLALILAIGGGVRMGFDIALRFGG